MKPKREQSKGPSSLRQATARRATPSPGKAFRGAHSRASADRLRHELDVHHIELEVQNAELRKVRDELESALENYTALYDLAPVGYFSIDETGVILEANLTGATLLGLERARLIQQRLTSFISPESRSSFLGFLKQVLAEPTGQTCEVLLLKEGAGTFWASFRAASAVSSQGPRKWCRVTFGDITARKQGEEAQQHLEVLAGANRELKREIVRRKAVEAALKKSEQHYAKLSEQAREMQDQLRLFSRRLLAALEEERMRISRELHDVIGQTLTGINVRLAVLKKSEPTKTAGWEQDLARAQELVEHAAETIHRFARELRPTVLDDLGLIPALRTFIKGFAGQTGIRVNLSAFAGVEEADGDKRTVLYRVAQEALTNIARHARAGRVEVKIQQRPGSVCMSIADDGLGFEPKPAVQGKANGRLGLLGMAERLKMVGGTFAIRSAPGKGTTIVAQIPFPWPPPGSRGARAVVDPAGIRRARNR